MVNDIDCMLRSIQRRTDSSIFGCLQPQNGINAEILARLRAKHDVSEAVFLVDHAHHLSAALNRAGPDFKLFAMEIGMLSNASFEK